MKFKFKAYLLVFIVISFSCSTTEKKEKNIKTILLKKTKEIQPISSFVSELDYIELKSPDSSLVIREIEDLKLFNNDIIIKHRVGSGSGFMRFSGKGVFLNKIGENKDKPGGILNPHDIIMYKNGYAVWAQRGIYLFSKSGEYQSKLFDVRLPGNSFFYSGNKFCFFHENTSPGYLSEYSPDGSLTHVFNPVKQDNPEIGNSAVTEIVKDSFHLFSPVNDTIFAFAHEKLLPEYVVEGKSYPTLEQILKKFDSRDSIKTVRYINSTQHWILKTYLENRNYIFIVYQLGSYPFHLIIQKSNWKITYVKEFINDIDGGVWDDPVFLSDNDELYIPLYAYQITSHEIRNKKRHGFDKIINRAKLTGNPVIMRCKLKNPVE